VSGDVAAAAAALGRGGLVLHATEGVWGFACDPLNESAVQRLLQVKGRDGAKGLLLIGATTAEFREELELQKTPLRAAAEASWPGPHTWVLPNVRFPAWVTGGRPTVACRVPGHDQARSLCAAFGRPLISTSANRTGDAPVITHTAATATFGELVDMVLCGEVATPGLASTIHGLDGKILRGG
jgi:L-threonylcarbamoyladenylate synthase